MGACCAERRRDDAELEGIISIISYSRGHISWDTSRGQVRTDVCGEMEEGSKMDWFTKGKDVIDLLYMSCGTGPDLGVKLA